MNMLKSVINWILYALRIKKRIKYKTIHTGAVNNSPVVSSEKVKIKHPCKYGNDKISITVRSERRRRYNVWCKRKKNMHRTSKRELGDLYRENIVEKEFIKKYPNPMKIAV